MIAKSAVAPDSLLSPPPVRPVGVGRFRWVICALLFAATTINYMDRQILGVLKPTLMGELGWSEIDYGNVVFAFSAAYALGYAFGGWLMDRVGVRLGLALAVFLWSF